MPTAQRTARRIISDHTQFAALKGDLTESVKLTPSIKGSSFNGFYLYKRTPISNQFIRKGSGDDIIEVVSCETRSLDFSKEHGIHPNYHFTSYGILSPGHPEFNRLKESNLLLREHGTKD
jgi:hypothetical protein